MLVGFEPSSPLADEGHKERETSSLARKSRSDGIARNERQTTAPAKIHQIKKNQSKET